MHASALQYWKDFGQVISDDLNVRSSMQDGRNEHCTKTNSSFLFPGRNQFRNGIVFDKVDKQDYTEHYCKGRTGAVPSFLTVQCT